MDILLKGVTIIDPSSPFHRTSADILIQNEFIAEIGSFEKTVDKEIAVEGLCVMPGFIDVFSHFCDPGFEYRETLETGALSAARGGFTDVLVLPNTQPVAHQKSGIEYIVQKSKSLPVNVHPVGSITKNAEGKELAEMYDMYQSGAVAFSDGTSALQSAGVLLKALQYLKAIDKTLIQLPDDRSISSNGLMNEGVISTQLGLAGKPAIAEELMIKRDIELTAYCDGRLHITGVSTAKGVDLIRKAKANGLNVSCSVTPYHLFFIDEDLFDYDTNLKLNPPLRTRKDRDGLIDAVIDGTVDCIASHHLPQHIDNKIVEFEYAKPGMIGLETCVAAVQTAIPQLSLERIVSLFSINPRKLFGLQSYQIKANTQAALTLFLPEQEWIPQTFASKSRNSAFGGKSLKGKPYGIINKGELFLTP